MKKIYIAVVLVILFLAAIVLDWNTQQESAQRMGGTSMITPRDDNILELEIGHPGGRNPLPEGNIPPSEPSPAQKPVSQERREVPRISPPPETASSDYYVYTVKEGDTVSQIAEKWLQTSRRADEIIRLNNIDDPRKITPGMRLKIPKK